MAGWRFIGARSSARCDVCERRDLHLFKRGEVFRCVNHLGQPQRREAMQRG